MGQRFGVGLVAAGPVTQAIHLPTIAAFGDELSVVHVTDPDHRLATAVASRYEDAHASSDFGELLADERVDIVVIGSPDRFHAEQVVRACERGVKAVLCEKPLAVDVDEARQLAAVSARLGTPVVVGTMHAFDPAWRAASTAWRELGEDAHMVRCTIELPTNDVFVSAATELAPGSDPSPRPASQSSLQERNALVLRRSIMGLLVHNVGLIRQLAGPVQRVALAEGFEPFGTHIVLDCGNTTVDIQTFMPGGWEPRWQLEAAGKDHCLTIDFPPSYVSAGSARAQITGGQHDMAWAFTENGYHHEWRQVIEAATGRSGPDPSISDAIDDFAYALDIARLAADADQHAPITRGALR